MEVVVVVVLVAVPVPVLVVAVPAYTIIYSVTFPHPSATICRQKNPNKIILWLMVLIRDETP